MTNNNYMLRAALYAIARQSVRLPHGWFI